MMIEERDGVIDEPTSLRIQEADRGGRGKVRWREERREGEEGEEVGRREEGMPPHFVGSG